MSGAKTCADFRRAFRQYIKILKQFADRGTEFDILAGLGLQQRNRYASSYSGYLVSRSNHANFEILKQIVGSGACRPERYPKIVAAGL